MKIFHYIKALSTVLVTFFLIISCSGNKKNEEQKSIIDKICISGEATAISISPDSSKLFVGFNENYFIEYDRKNHTSVKFVLPEETNSVKTYQIKELRNDGDGREFLASKRNSGVMWLKYNSLPDSDNIFSPSKCVYLSSENSTDILPQKGKNYSVYKIIEGIDSTLYFASSNGMMYLTREMLNSMKLISDTNVFSVPYLPSLRPMRQNRMQFSNEDVFVDNHSGKLIAVTDSGIYRLSANHNSPNYEKLLTGGRFKVAYMGNDTLWAVSSQPEGSMLLTIINPYSDNFKISTKNINPNCKIINKKIFGYASGNVDIGDKSFELGLEVIGRESLQVINDDMYYISEDAVCYVNINLLTKINDIVYSPIKTAVKGEDDTFYFLTHNALYKYNVNLNNYEYLGEIYDLPLIKDATWHDGNIYICDDNSVYTISTAHSMFAFGRKAQRIENITVKSPDKIESLGIDANKGIYVGSRSGLSLYGFDGENKPIKVNIKKFDSPYITDIAEGGEYASTLNYGLLRIGTVAESVSGYENYHDIRSVDKCGEHLCFNTPIEVVVVNLTAHKTIGGKAIKCKNIIDARFIDANTIGILTTDSILQYSIVANSLIKKSSKANRLAYQQLLANNSKEVLISKYPIANGTPIMAQNLSWSEVIYIALSIIVAIAISIYIIVYIMRLKRLHKFNISRLRHRHTSEITQLNTSHNQQISQLNKKHNTQMTQLNESLKERERNIARDFDLRKSYTTSATKLIKHISKIYSNYEIYREKEKSLEILKDAFSNFKKSVSPLLAKTIEVSDIEIIKDAYEKLYQDFFNWLNTTEKDSKEVLYKRCRYGLCMLNIRGSGIRSLIEKHNEEFKTEKEELQTKAERDAVWELFYRYVIIGTELGSKISNNIVDNMSQDILVLHHNGKSGWKKLLKERISHKNVGAITNLLWSNLSPNIWEQHNDQYIAQTPYDVMWCAFNISNHTNGLLEELKKANEILSNKTTKHS